MPSDDTFVASIANCIRTQSRKASGSGHMYVEAAGGVHSPALSGTTQADCYRPLCLPTVLIGDSRLGGISSTISSYESLLLRGYSIDAVLLFQDDYYRNGQYLKPYFKAQGIFLATLLPPPPKLPDPVQNFESTQQYYDSIAAQEDISAVIEHLDLCHVGRIQELESMPRRALDTIWWPFVQHGLVHKNDVTVIDSAHSDFFTVSNKSVGEDPSSKGNLLSPQLDGSASWWTQVVGHAHPSLTLAAARASGRYGHVMFPQAVHLPALKLAEKLIRDGPGKGWASRVFFSDNGSTGMEVALKMAIRAYCSRHGERLTKDSRKKLGILGLKGSYHGDTIGAMNACEEGVYTCEWHNAQGYWLSPPTVGVSDGQVTIRLPDSLGMRTQCVPSLAWVYDIEERLHTPLARAYVEYFNRILPSLKDRLAALVLEPLIMGAGGMLFVDPLFQRLLVDTVRNRSSGSSTTWSGMPVIFDEVFVGLNRVGVPSSGPLLGIHPDISVYAKALTGGLVPLAVTLASRSIFDAFLSDKKGDALLHGHSYSAHAVGCEVANEALALMEKISVCDDWISAKARWAKPDGSKSSIWSLWDPEFITAISHLPNVEETMTLGSVLSIRVQDRTGGKALRR